MTGSGGERWRQVRVGRERALELRTGDGLSVLFGQGPPRRGREPGERMRDLYRDLAADIHALCWCRQVHGVQIRVVDATAAGATMLGTGDGLLTAGTGTALLLQTADCVPVLAAGRRVVAAAHAGWRGAAGGIIPRLLDLCRRLHHEEPAALRAFLGPAICVDHYPVGAEVIAALAGQGVDPSRWRRGDQVDLRAFLSAQLNDLGVGRVQKVGECTACIPALASYRRDGDSAGRQLSLVYRRDR